MSNTIATAWVEIRSKGDKGKNEARDQARAMAKEATRAFAQFFTAAVFVDQINQAIRSASQLEQAVGGSQAVFQASQHIVQDFADTAAESFGISQRAALELTTSMGALLQGLGFTEDQAAATAVEVAQLGADLAAAFGGRPEDAVAALGSALRGEFDPLEQFGVSLRQSEINLRAVELGLADSTTQVDANAKAQATLSLIMEQTARVQGQAGREADTAAGRQARLAASFEDMRAKLGTQLLPVFAQVVELLSVLVDGFSSLPGPVQTAVVALAGIAAVSGPVKNLVGAFGGLTKIVGGLGAATGPIAGVAAVIGVAALAVNHFRSRNEEAERQVKLAADAMVAQTDVAWANAEAMGVAADEALAVAVANEAMTAALRTFVDENDAVRDALLAANMSIEQALDIVLQYSRDPVEGFVALAEHIGYTEEQARNLVRTTSDGELDWTAIYEGAEASGMLTDQLRLVESTFMGLVGPTDHLNTVLAEGTQAYLDQQILAGGLAQELALLAESNVAQTDAAGDAVAIYLEYGRLIAELPAAEREAILAGSDLATANTEVATTATEASTAVDQLTKANTALSTRLAVADAAAARLGGAFDQVTGPAFELAAAEEELFAATAAVGESLTENGATLDRSTAAGRANREAVRAAAQSYMDYATSLVRSGFAADDAAAQVDSYVARLRDQMIAANFSAEAVDAYIESLNLTPDDVSTALVLEGEAYAAETISRFTSMLGEIPPTQVTEIQALIDEGKFNVVNAALDEIAAGGEMSSEAIAGFVTLMTGTDPFNAAALDIFADGLADVGDEAVVATRRARALKDASSALGDELDAAAVAADDLQSALDRINGPADDLREATRGVWEELDNMAGALEENGNGFDSSTEAGRANQRQLEATRDAILAHGIALVQNGSSATEAAGDIAYNTEALREQMLAASLTEEQVDALIETYGLTPEQVTTAIELAGIERTNRLIEQHNANLGLIPERMSTYIESLIDQGKLDQAEYLLNNLARLRVASIVASITHRGGSTFVMQAQAEGGYVDHAGLFLRGEAGPEAVLPLDRPSRIRDLLADARIGAPIAAALGGDSYVGASNSLSIGAINVTDRRDLPEALDEVDSWWWRFKVGARA